MSITSGIVSSKIYDRRDDFNFEQINFAFLDGDVPTLLMVNIFRDSSVLRECVLNNRNLFLTVKLLKQGYRYHKFEKHFLNSTADTQS